MSLIVALGLMMSGAANSAEPTNTGGSAGQSASGNATPLPSTETWVVAGAAVIGTAVGLSVDSNDNSTSTSTSTATATAP